MADDTSPTPPHPRTVRADRALTAEDVCERLAPDAITPALDHLSITGIDRDELLAALPRVLADPDALRAVTETANLLRREAGLDAAPANLEPLRGRLEALQQRICPGQGLLVILAHVAATDTVRAWHTARRLSSDQSWTALADLGQQMRVHRMVTGRLGLSTEAWTALAWAGRLFTLGRLQFDLSRTDAGTDPLPGPARWIIGVHIPASGPLTPEAVDAALDQATAFFPHRFPELADGLPAGVPAVGHEFRCSSWLLNPALAQIAGPGSNLARFSARWQILGTRPAADDAAFFVFHRRPPYDPAALPRRTRLQRALAERLADGRGWDLGWGLLVR